MRIQSQTLLVGFVAGIVFVAACPDDPSAARGSGTGDDGGSSGVLTVTAATAATGDGGGSGAGECTLICPDQVQTIPASEDPAQWESGRAVLLDAQAIVEGPFFVSVMTASGEVNVSVGADCSGPPNATLQFFLGRSETDDFAGRFFVPAGQTLCASSAASFGAEAGFAWSGFRPY